MPDWEVVPHEIAEGNGGKKSGVGGNQAWNAPGGEERKGD
jgi:hypothetical protein